MKSGSIIMEVLGIVALVVGIWALRKEKKLGGFYKTLGLFGRLYAFIAVDFVLGAILAFIAAITGLTETTGAVIVAGIVILAIGVLMYWRVISKCGDLSKVRTVVDMTIVGFGSIVRISLFFVAFLFKTWLVFSKPTAYRLDDGTVVYLFPGSDRLYNEHGYQVGVINDSRTKALIG